MKKYQKVKNPQYGKKQNLLGLTFGKLKVIQEAGRTATKKVLWNCLCECGNFHTYVTSELRSGSVTSCGCSNMATGSAHRAWKGCGEISGQMWGSIKNGATKRELPFNISINDAWNQFIKQNRKCKLTGLSLTFATRQCKKRDNIKNNRSNGTASLDRIDSKKGYELNNIQWVHKDVNMMKNKFDEDFFLHISRLITYNKKTLKIKRLDRSISMPRYATPGSVGFDICAAKTVEVPPGAVGIIPTGLAVQVPDGTELTIRPRSGMSVKTPIRVILGTIDSDYFQEVGIIVENRNTYTSGFGGNGSYTIEKGQRIAQGVLSPVLKPELEEVDEILNDTEHLGFGSTDRSEEVYKAAHKVMNQYDQTFKNLVKKGD